MKGRLGGVGKDGYIIKMFFFFLEDENQHDAL